MVTLLEYEGPDLTEYRHEYHEIAKADLNLPFQEDGGASTGRVPQPRGWFRDLAGRRATVNT